MIFVYSDFKINKKGKEKEKKEEDVFRYQSTNDNSLCIYIFFDLILHYDMLCYLFRFLGMDYLVRF